MILFILWFIAEKWELIMGSAKKKMGTMKAGGKVQFAES